MQRSLVFSLPGVWSLLGLLGVLWPAMPAQAATRTVGPAGSGADFTTIQAAIDASKNLDEVVVSPGMYTENVNFKGKSLTLRSSSGASLTTIKGTSTTLTLTSAENSATLIKGFTVVSASYGLNTTGSAPRLEDVTFSAPTGSYAVYASDSGASFKNVSFINGRTSYTFYAAGAKTNLVLDGCTFSGNTSVNGGAMHLVGGAVEVKGSTFSSNAATSNYGGAIYLSGAALTLSSNTFERNRASYGGALYLEGGTNRLYFQSNTFFANVAVQHGGALYLNDSTQVYISDNRLVENVGQVEGGAFYLASGVDSAILNNTLVGNESPKGGGLLLKESTGTLLLNNIIAFSSNGHGVLATNNTSRINAWYNDVYGNFSGAWSGTADPTGARGNLAVDPGLVAYSDDGTLGNDNLALSSTSPLRDAGSTRFGDADGSPADLGAGGAKDDALPTDGTVYVSPLPGSPYSSIQAAINAAPYGGTILVYPGTYSGDLNFKGKDLKLKSAFGPDTALLAGAATTLTFSTGETANALVEGFTLWTSGSYAVYASSSAPVLKDNHFRSSYGSYVIYATGGGPTIQGGRIENNAPSYVILVEGSTTNLCKLKIIGTYLGNNTSVNGGALHTTTYSTPIVQGATFEKNQATSNYGGAIYSTARLLTIEGSTFMQNKANYGGAVYAEGKTLLRDSRFLGNTATVYGGALHYNDLSAHTIDCLFQENSATEGGAVYHASAAQSALINNTFVGNAAGKGGHLLMKESTNSLLLQNIFAETLAGEAVYSTAASSRILSWNNLFYESYAGHFGGFAEDVIGLRNNLEADPEFASFTLQDGRFDDDFTVLEGSPAIDAGDPEFLDEDGSPADLGMGGGDDDRQVSGASATVSPFTWSTHATPKDAIAASITGAKIWVYPGVYYGDFSFGGKDLLLKGIYGRETVVLAGAATTVTFNTTESKSAVLEDVTLFSEGSYAIYTSGSAPTFSKVDIRACRGSYATYHTGGAPVYKDVLVQGNAPSYTTLIEGASRPVITGSTWADNTSVNGGAIHVIGNSILSIAGSTFLDNQATSNYGGAIYQSSSTLLVRSSTFEGNRANYGGAIYAEPTTLTNLTTLRDSLFFNNVAVQYGGALHLNDGRIAVVDTYLLENEASYGGAVYAASGSHLTSLNNTLLGNRGAFGGGFYLKESTNSLITNTLIAWSADGTGIHTLDKTARALVSYSNVYANADGNYGGTITDRTADHGNQSTDPQFVAYSRDGILSNDTLTYKPTSTMKDRGLPAFPDTDGSPSDLGVGGGNDDARVSGYDLVVSPLQDTSYNALSTALTAAVAGQRIAVYPGLYYSDLDFKGKNVSVTGVYGQLGTVQVGASAAVNLDQGEGSVSSPLQVKGLSLWSEGSYVIQQGASAATFTECAIRYAYGSYAVYSNAGTLNLVKSLLEQNAPSYPMLFEGKAKVVISGSSLLNNTAVNGGAIHMVGASDVTLDTSRLAYNKATSNYGGAVYCSGSTLQLQNTSVQNNTANYGGGLYLDSCTTSLKTSYLMKNTALQQGGGLRSAGGRITAYNTIFQNNEAPDGGGAYAHSGAVDAYTNCNFIENASTGKGGGLFANSGSALSLVNSIFAYQTNGEGLYLTSGISSYSLVYNDFFQNFDGPLAGVITALPASNLTASPAFVSYSQDGNPTNDDERLATGSPLIDGGSPNLNDADGSRSDIGAYGGAGGPELDKDGDGYSATEGDCNDSDPTVYPGAIELNDDKDNDCNGVVDDPFTDKDGDGYDPIAGDCNDQNPYINPGMSEACDGLDQDCDGQVDEGVKSTWYVDSDGDGFGSPVVKAEACSKPAGYSSLSTDCNDSDASIRPTAAEVCDGKDNDCDSQIDESLATTYYLDADGDAYGDTQVTQVACTLPAGYALVGGDCNEADTTIHPNAAETCNTKDDDCDGQVDDGVKTTYYLDSDADGYGSTSQTTQACQAPERYLTQGGDCDDAQPTVHPGATETCDSLDNDCDGSINEGLNQTWYTDADGDGYGLTSASRSDCVQPANTSATPGDCDDTRAEVKPGATETCDRVDNDCDGLTDEDLARTWYTDADGDGYGDASGSTQSSQVACAQPTGWVADHTDCNDSTSAIHPGASEACNSLDDDCDGSADEGLTQTVYYADQDGDGYGDPTQPSQSCKGAPLGSVATSGDCNDSDALIHPGASERCNGLDDSCEGQADEGLVFTSWYRDADGDGFGNAASAQSTCSGAPAGSVASSTDCNDNDAAIHPDAKEVCDALDNNCSGQADEGFDQDQDLSLACALGAAPADCNDQDPAVYPGNTEVCDGKDNNCNQEVDEVRDEDQDGYTGCGTPADCDDTDASVYPGAPERCDDQDNNCNGQSDEGFDTDQDGYFQCAHDGRSLDCLDTDPHIHPDASETCDGQDNNCDGQTDEGVQLSYCMDSDGDGFGNPAEPGQACTLPTDATANCTDLDDTDAATHPGAPEAPDGVDNDGDGQIDEGTLYSDDDHDGFTEVAGDCNDQNPYTYPGAPEIDDNTDNDCDGLVDEDPDQVDDDGDGLSEAEGDCNDAQDATSPQATEIADGIDNDCDGLIDEGTSAADDDGDGFTEADGDCDDTEVYTHPGAPEWADGDDNDCDGAVDEDMDTADNDGDGLSEAEGDFDDTNPESYPGASESCDGQDNNQNGTVDEGTECGDDDGDGFTEQQGDCNDDSPYTSPVVEDIPADGADNDCDGTIDGSSDDPLPTPDAQLSTTTLDLGSVQVGQRQTGSLVLVNRGDGTLTIRGVSLEESDSPFEVLSSSSVLIPPGGSYPIWFQFSPTEEGTFTAQARLETDDPDSPLQALTLEGRGLPAPTEATPTPEASPQPTGAPEPATPTPGDPQPSPEPSPDDSGEQTAAGGCGCTQGSESSPLSLPAGGILLIGLGLLHLRRRPRA